MGKKKLKTIDEVNHALGVKDVSEISSNHAVKFIGLLSDIDKDVALQLLNLCPDLIQITPEVLNAFEKMNEIALQKESEANNAVIYAYQSIIDECRRALEDGELSFEEREKLLSKMVEIADKLAAKDSEHKQWIKDIHDKTAKYGLAALGIVTGIVAAIVIADNKKKE